MHPATLPPTQRTLHLIDLENLAGDPYAAEPVVRAVLDAYLEAARWQRGDIVFIAANRWLIMQCCWTLPVDASVRTASGPDGADNALLAAAPPEWVARRFGRLVVGSGDGIFAARAAQIRDLGVAVEVVSRSSALSGALRRLGGPVHLLGGAGRMDLSVSGRAAPFVVGPAVAA